MSSMRWGDSDSSDEDEIKVSSLPVPGQQDLAPPPRRSVPPPSQRQRTPPRSRGGSQLQLQQQRNNRTPPRGRDYRSKSNRNTGGGRGQGAADWKQLAKSSSRFAPTSDGNKQQRSVDGSAWMAQRRKKQEEEEEQERLRHEERLRQEEEEKRNRRKSQFSALKEAVKEIESSSSSLQAAASPKRVAAPTKILTRPPDQVPKQQTSWRDSHPKPRQDGQHQHESWRKPKGATQNRPASPDHSLDDSRSIQSSSTTSSRTSKMSQKGRGGGRGRGNERGVGSQGRHNDHRGRGRGKRGGGKDYSGRKGGRVQAGKTSVVRTPSGNVEYHVALEEDPKTKGELLPNGTVRLSRNKKKNKPHKQQHTSIQTSLEIGKLEEKK